MAQSEFPGLFVPMRRATPARGGNETSEHPKMKNLKKRRIPANRTAAQAGMIGGKTKQTRQN
jgi:hypothetical protein